LACFCYLPVAMCNRHNCLVYIYIYIYIYIYKYIYVYI
jgi:hypothetical protein